MFKINLSHKQGIRIKLLLTVLTIASCTNSDDSDWVGTPVKPLPYTMEELLDPVPRTAYEGDSLRQIAFPMGGIGAGCISLAGNGALIDWEIFNNPNKGYRPYFSFLSAWAKAEGEDPVFKVLEGPLQQRLDGPRYSAKEFKKPWWIDDNGLGVVRKYGSTLPRMRTCKFEGKFPFASVKLKDKTFPLDVKVEGWSPFIPNDSRSSSLPVAVLNVTFQNNGDKKVEAVLAANTQNKAGEYNRLIRKKGANIMLMTDSLHETGKSMFMATPADVTTWQTQWHPSDWWQDVVHFANTFVKTGEFDTVNFDYQDGVVMEKPQKARTENAKTASIGTKIMVAPGDKITIPIIYGWYFPSASWGKNYYATQWTSGLDVANFTLENLTNLERQTRQFQNAFFASKLPGVVLESISSQLSILRSTTVVRFEDGTLYGWEGTTHNRRLGSGTCSHVWNYQQAVPYLFPDLQRSIIENFLTNGIKENGAVDFRLPEVFGQPSNHNKTAADGQLGQVCWVYREFLISGDLEWLKRWWPATKKALEFAWETWDRDKDGLLEGSHHNTLDLNFSTPETMCGSMYQAALLAGEKMALLMGDSKSAGNYRQIFEKGKALTKKHLFNGEYYHQMPIDKGLQMLKTSVSQGDEMKEISGLSTDYQLLNGCISEQVGGQLYARMLGLEDIYDRNNLHTALGNLFKYNYKEDFYDFVNAFRGYALGDEKGLLIATWPQDDRPEVPLLYCDETQIGYEYQVAGNLLYEDYLLEGLTVIKSIRDRFDGEKRNPFCEFEWGNHYARSMANYNQLLALSGFRYNGYEKKMRLAPKLNKEDFNAFFSVDGAWGNIIQTTDDTAQIVRIKVESGELPIQKLVVKTEGHPMDVKVNKNGQPVIAVIEAATDESWQSGNFVLIKFEQTVEVNVNDDLEISIGL